MLTQRTHKVLRQRLPFIHVPANLADVTDFLLFGLLRGGFDVFKIVVVSDGRVVVKSDGLFDFGDKDDVAAAVDPIHYLAADHRIDAVGNILDVVSGARVGLDKFINVKTNNKI